jgi:hypothetical protein
MHILETEKSDKSLSCVFKWKESDDCKYGRTHSFVAMSYWAILTSSPSIEKFPATTRTRLAFMFGLVLVTIASLFITLQHGLKILLNNI